jgi:ADYC domain/Pentapeptide repeats (8 copies)
MLKSTRPILVTLALLAGCAPQAGTEPETDADLGDSLAGAGALETEGTSLNGTSLNGTSLNGTSLNGTSLNGTSLNGTSLNGTSLNGTSLNGVTLNVTSFSGTKADGTPVSGDGFVGTVFNGALSNGQTLKLRIDSRAPLPAPNADVYAYNVSYQTSAGWSPLCGTGAGGAIVAAIPLSGTWNYASGVAGGGGFTASSTNFTFACRATAVAKCVELGYKPWKTVNGVSLQNHQVACTRMLRADYCGNGTSYTVNGTPINIYDNVGVQADTQAWQIEADWTAAGARFISSGADQRFRQTKGTPPACFSAKVNSGAGNPANFSSGTLIINEYQN